MTNQQGAPEALRLAAEVLDWMPTSDTQRALWDRHQEALAVVKAALVDAQQPTTHVQNPAEIAHVAGDVSKNRPESNMAQQPAPSAAPLPVAGVERTFGFWQTHPEDKPLGDHSMVPLTQADKAYGWTEVALIAAPQTDSHPAPVLDEREAFEAWFKREYHSRLCRNMPDKSYNDPMANSTWIGWQARAARAPADSVTAPAGGVGPDGMMRDELRSMIEGMSVSVDVSTGDHDAGHRYFGTVTEVMDCREDKQGVTLLVQDAEPNFTPTPPAQAADSVLEDHQIAKLVNDLRDIAIQYRDTQQLRERISHAVVQALKVQVDSAARKQGGKP